MHAKVRGNALRKVLLSLMITTQPQANILYSTSIQVKVSYHLKSYTWHPHQNPQCLLSFAFYCLIFQIKFSVQLFVWSESHACSSIYCAEFISLQCSCTIRFSPSQLQQKKWLGSFRSAGDCSFPQPVKPFVFTTVSSLPPPLTLHPYSRFCLSLYLCNASSFLLLSAASFPCLLSPLPSLSLHTCLLWNSSSVSAYHPPLLHPCLFRSTPCPTHYHPSPSDQIPILNSHYFSRPPAVCRSRGCR